MILYADFFKAKVTIFFKTDYNNIYLLLNEVNKLYNSLSSEKKQKRIKVKQDIVIFVSRILLNIFTFLTHIRYCGCRGQQSELFSILPMYYNKHYIKLRFTYHQCSYLEVPFVCIFVGYDVISPIKQTRAVRVHIYTIIIINTTTL